MRQALIRGNYREIARLEGVSVSSASTYAENIRGGKDNQPRLQSHCKGKRKIAQRIDRIMVGKLLENSKATLKKFQTNLVIGLFVHSNIETPTC